MSQNPKIEKPFSTLWGEPLFHPSVLRPSHTHGVRWNDDGSLVCCCLKEIEGCQKQSNGRQAANQCKTTCDIVAHLQGS